MRTVQVKEPWENIDSRMLERIERIERISQVFLAKADTAVTSWPNICYASVPDCEGYVMHPPEAI